MFVSYVCSVLESRTLCFLLHGFQFRRQEAYPHLYKLLQRYMQQEQAKRQVLQEDSRSLDSLVQWIECEDDAEHERRISPSHNDTTKKKKHKKKKKKVTFCVATLQFCCISCELDRNTIIPVNMHRNKFLSLVFWPR